MLRVCILTETYHPVIGGGETQARLLADGLAEAGATVFVLTRRSRGNLARIERQGHVEVHRLGPPGSGQFMKWGLILTCVPRLLRLRNHYDLVLVAGFRIVGPAAVSVAKLLRKVVVLKADSRGEMSGTFFAAGLSKAGLSPAFLPFRLFLLVRNAVLRWADAFVAITPDIGDELTGARIPSSKVYRIPNGVDTTRFSPPTLQDKRALRRRIGLPADARVVVYTGRLVSYKGLPMLLEVWPEVLGHHPQAHLLLVGSGGLDIHNCESALRSTVDRAGLASSVTFVGDVEDVSPYLRAADIFVLPTENDAFPSAVIEAMASGLAVLTTPVGAIPTIIRDGENGVMVQPRDPSGLRDALAELLTESPKAARLGSAARISVVGQFSAESVTSRYLELFRKLDRCNGAT